MSTEPVNPHADRLGEFSADALDFEAVRGLFRGLSFTGLGRRTVNELSPAEPAVIRERLARLTEVLDLAAARDLPGLGGLTDPVPVLERVRRDGRPLDKEELIQLRAFLGTNARLAGWLADRAEESPRLGALGAGLPDLSGVLQLLDRVVDERGVVRDEASPRLARLRRDMRELDQRIGVILRRVMARPGLRSVLSDTNVHRRAGRGVLAVKVRSAGRLQGIVHDRSQSEQTVFVEPREAVEPGNRLATARIDERNEQARVLIELCRELLDHEGELRAAAERLGELELALISQRFCQRHGARVPEIAQERGAAGGLLLRRARHPLLAEHLLQERLEEVVPIDVRLGQDFDMLVITGPNTGGKTLALKTVGLAVLLARVGLPVVCAEGSRVPLYEGICADIGDEQEVSQNLSTFASHLVRIRDGLARATPSTLVLLDELGGGTDPDEGAALGDAVLEHLLERAVPTLATTHLGKLKEFAYRHARAENACVEFDAKTLEPRYRLLVGTPGESSALVIAARLGMPSELVEAAQERQVRRAGEVARLMEDMRGARQAVEQARAQVDERLEDLARKGRKLEAKEGELDRRRDLVEAEAQRDLEGRVRDARRELGGATTLAEQAPGRVREELRGILRRVDEHLSGAALTDRRREFLDGLAKGQYVYLPRFKKRCVVSRIDRTRREVTVRMGKVPVKVSFDELTRHEGI